MQPATFRGRFLGITGELRGFGAVMTREQVEDVSEFERRRVEELLARTPRLSERWPRSIQCPCGCIVPVVVSNLRLASSHVDGLLIRPGETFSFNRTVGNCTARKGYVTGMRLRNGEAIQGSAAGSASSATSSTGLLCTATSPSRSARSTRSIPSPTRDASCRGARA